MHQELRPGQMDERYWEKRSSMRYYKDYEVIVRKIAADATSMIDVGTGIVPYLEWFDWIPEKISVDINPPYESDTVRGIQGDIFEMDFGKKFDICTCLQVLEHIPDPAPFARRLMELSDLVVISVPYKWPMGKCKGHVNDPVDLNKIIDWFGRKPNYHHTVHEPYRKHSSRLIAIFDMADPNRRFDLKFRWIPWPL